MAAKKRFLLRMDPKLWVALERWAAEDLRSINGQIEFLLTQAARRAGRLKAPGGGDDPYRGAPQGAEAEEDDDA